MIDEYVCIRICREESCSKAKAIYQQMRLEEIATSEVYSKSVTENQQSEQSMRSFEMEEKQKKYVT